MYYILFIVAHNEGKKLVNIVKHSHSASYLKLKYVDHLSLSKFLFHTVKNIALPIKPVRTYLLKMLLNGLITPHEVAARP